MAMLLSTSRMVSQAFIRLFIERYNTWTTEPVTEIKGMKLLTNYTPPHEGYITWGDNNPRPDQGLNYPGIGIIEPVKDEWMIGKALFSIPLVGYLPLHIIEVTFVIVGIMVLYELYQRSQENKKESRPKKNRKKQR